MRGGELFGYLGGAFILDEALRSVNWTGWTIAPHGLAIEMVADPRDDATRRFGNGQWLRWWVHRKEFRCTAATIVANCSNDDDAMVVQEIIFPCSTQELPDGDVLFQLSSGGY